MKLSKGILLGQDGYFTNDLIKILKCSIPMSLICQKMYSNLR